MQADKTGRESTKISDETQEEACRFGAEISGFHFKITEPRFVFLFKFVTVSVLSTVICVNYVKTQARHSRSLASSYSHSKASC